MHCYVCTSHNAWKINDLYTLAEFQSQADQHIYHRSVDLRRGQTFKYNNFDNLFEAFQIVKTTYRPHYSLYPYFGTSGDPLT
jgi:hypothetical protein